MADLGDDGQHGLAHDGAGDPHLDPLLVGDGGEASQLPSASAAHELADALDDGGGGGGGSHTLPQAFWDALPLGDTMHDQGRQTNSSSHTPTMEDLHAVMSHDPHPHPYGHPDDSAHYDPFDPPQSDPSSLPESSLASQLHVHRQDGQAHADGSGQQQQHGQDGQEGPGQDQQQQQQQQQDQHQHHHQAAQEPMNELHDDVLHLLGGAGRDPSGSGSPEPKLSRKETHKMVERRRREVITKGINELADLLPAQEKNKSLILGRAADYLRQLKRTEVANLEKWAMEKIMMEQAMSDLRAMLEDERAKRRELEQTLHGIGRSAGLSGYGDDAPEEVEQQQQQQQATTEPAVDEHGGKRGPDGDDDVDGSAAKRARAG